MDPLLEGTVPRGGADALRTFRDAFITEIGSSELGHPGRLVSLRELLDVCICAGKDVLIQDLRRLRPYASDKDEIFSFDECFQIYQSIPSTALNEIYDLLGIFAIAESEDGIELDWPILLAKLDREGKGELSKWLRKHGQRETDMESLIYELVDTKKKLRAINAQIVDEEGLAKQDENLAFLPARSATFDEGSSHKVSSASFMLPRSDSAESLSSLFSTRRSNTGAVKEMIGSQGQAGTGPSPSAQALPPAHQGGSSSFREQEERIHLKSLVIQRELTETSCIAYAFALEKPRKLRLAICVNEGIDSSLSRFHNSVQGIIMSSELDPQPRIFAVTKRKDQGMALTEWVQVPAGNHLVRVKFCRALKMVEPEKSDLIVDEKGRLTKPFKVMLMNLFDVFDLDDDGLMSRREFEAYSILSGSGPVSEQEWTRICTNFELRQQHIPIKTFVQMHQREADTYGPKGNLEEMWKAVRALGHNRKFFLSTTCPLRLELHCSEGNPLLIEPFRVDRFHSDELDPLLAEHFWELGKPLPYLKDLQSLRQYKADYFVVLVAGRTEQPKHYALDLKGSNNVNIEGMEAAINQTVPAGTIRILTVAIAQAENWFLSVKLGGSTPSKQQAKADGKKGQAAKKPN